MHWQRCKAHDDDDNADDDDVDDDLAALAFSLCGCQPSTAGHVPLLPCTHAQPSNGNASHDVCGNSGSISIRCLPRGTEVHCHCATEQTVALPRDN